MKNDEMEPGVKTITLGGMTHPINRVPIEHYEEFKKLHPGSQVKFRGPRKEGRDTRKEDATHFYVYSIR